MTAWWKPCSIRKLVPTIRMLYQQRTSGGAYPMFAILMKIRLLFLKRLEKRKSTKEYHRSAENLFNETFFTFSDDEIPYFVCRFFASINSENFYPSRINKIRELLAGMNTKSRPQSREGTREGWSMTRWS